MSIKLSLTQILVSGIKLVSVWKTCSGLHLSRVHLGESGEYLVEFG